MRRAVFRRVENVMRMCVLWRLSVAGDALWRVTEHARWRIAGVDDRERLWRDGKRHGQIADHLAIHLHWHRALRFDAQALRALVAYMRPGVWQSQEGAPQYIYAMQDAT